MSLSTSDRLQYLLWAGTRACLAPDKKCPGCGSAGTTLVRRKYLVTSLWECTACALRFRVPKDQLDSAEDFYQEAYTEGFTTDCPSPETLESLISTGFAGTEKDYSAYLSVLGSVGLKPGDPMLDFGSSWGYGSWQLSRAGFKVFSYEISRPRAEYAGTKLGCSMVRSPDDLQARVKCLFSAHVIEHLPNPSLMWEVADKILTDEGLIVCFCPNGEPAREALVSVGDYDQLWGKVHPVMITPQYLRNMSARHGWSAQICSTPFEMDRIGAPGTTTGEELCLIARRGARVDNGQGKKTLV
jgi:hypothetical protein